MRTRTVNALDLLARKRTGRRFHLADSFTLADFRVKTPGGNILALAVSKEGK